MKKLLLIVTGAMLLSLASISAVAGAGNSGTAPSPTVVPERGMTMETVEQRFGQPSRKIAPVGEPPISRWIYSEFTVYFERQYVIHTVVTSSSP